MTQDPSIPDDSNDKSPVLLGNGKSPSDPSNLSPGSLPCVCTSTDGANERPAVTREHRCGAKSKTDGKVRHVSFDLEKNRVFTVQRARSDTL